MSAYDAIDLTRLPLPAAVEVLDFEVILAALKADLILRAPELTGVIDLESEPVVKLLEVVAFREVIWRARANDSVRAVHLATAAGTDIDALAALFGVMRLTITPADPLAIPPAAAVMEADGDLRARTQLALEGFSTAGPVGGYVFHALSASGQVKDVSVETPTPGTVRVTVLSIAGQGIPDAPLLAAVTTALNAEDVRPLCDTVVVQAATITTYTVVASLTMFGGPDPALTLAEAQAAVLAYVNENHRLGRAIRRSALFAALHRPGVATVTLTQPAADIVPTLAQAAFCTARTVTVVP